MMRLLFVGWLISIGMAFHLGWWGRWRMNQKLKARAQEESDKAAAEGAGPSILRGIMMSYWEAL